MAQFVAPSRGRGADGPVLRHHAENDVTKYTTNMPDAHTFGPHATGAC